MYSGYQPFVSAGPTQVTEEQVEGGIQKVWDKYCHN
jgi:hypothetical protein